MQKRHSERSVKPGIVSEDSNVLQKDDEAALGYSEKKIKTKRCKSKLDFFEHDLSKKPKGSYLVYSTNINVSKKNIFIYLHAVNSSKVVYRLSNKYAASPSVPLEMSIADQSTGKKRKITGQTSEAQYTFREQMGHNDQSDGKRSRIGLSSRYYKR